MSFRDELSPGVKLGDPRPAFCSNCHGTEADRFVSFPAAHDSGSFIRPPEGEYVAGSDDLNLCEPCVRAAMGVLELKPELHQRQLREIKRLEVENEHWRDYARTLEATLEARPEPAPKAMRRAPQVDRVAV